MDLRDRAKQLRRTMTLPEVKLWRRLKTLNRNGFHFHRQCPLDLFIFDFAELSHRLIVEVDGPHHENDTRDASRDRHFEREGFTVLRFWNHQIDRELDEVVARIERVLANPLTRRAIARHPPHKGEG